MILEQPTINVVALQTYDTIAEEWADWLASAISVDVTRGGQLAAPTSTVDVGTLTVALKNAGDPLTDATLVPNLLIRLVSVPDGEELFTGRITDLATAYSLDKQTGELTTYVTIAAADAVAAHANTTRYGAVTPGGVGFESWALRIIRLAASSVTAINPPADDSPIVRYAI